MIDRNENFLLAVDSILSIINFENDFDVIKQNKIITSSFFYKIANHCKGGSSFIILFLRKLLIENFVMIKKLDFLA